MKKYFIHIILVCLLLNSCKTMQSETAFNKGVKAEKTGNIAIAQDFYEKAITINPNHFMGYARLGRIYTKQENYEKAAEIYMKALDINSNSAGLFYDIGVFYGKLENYEKALECFQKAAILYSHHFAVHGNLSFCYIFTKDYKKSEQSALKGLSIDSTQTWIKINLAAALLFQGKYEEARSIYFEVLETPKDGKSYAEICLEDLDKYEKADAIPETQKENVEKIRQLLNKE